MRRILNFNKKHAKATKERNQALKVKPRELGVALLHCSRFGGVAKSVSAGS